MDYWVETNVKVYHFATRKEANDFINALLRASGDEYMRNAWGI